MLFNSRWNDMIKEIKASYCNLMGALIETYISCWSYPNEFIFQHAFPNAETLTIIYAHSNVIIS